MGGAIVLGGAAGYLTGWLQNVAERRKLSDEGELLTVALALSLVVLAGADLLGTNSILAVFAAGLGFHQIARDRLENKEGRFQDVIQRFFQLPIFVLLGAMLPWREWTQLGAPGLLLVVAILMLRRLPIWLLLKPVTPELKTWRQAMFAGWFGPLGISALFYVTLALGKTGDERLWAVTTLLVTASIIIHGLSSTPLGTWLAREDTEPQR